MNSLVAAAAAGAVVAAAAAAVEKKLWVVSKLKLVKWSLKPFERNETLLLPGRQLFMTHCVVVVVVVGLLLTLTTFDGCLCFYVCC